MPLYLVEINILKITPMYGFNSQGDWLQVNDYTTQVWDQYSTGFTEYFTQTTTVKVFIGYVFR